MRTAMRLASTPAVASSLAIGSAAVGAGLAGLGGLTHPSATALLPVVVVAAAAALRQPVVAIVGVVVALPVGTARIAGFDLIELVLIAAVGLVAIARLTSARIPLGWATPLSWLLPLIVASVVATASALDPERAIRQELILLAGVALASATIAALASERELRWTAVILSVTGGGICLHATLTTGPLRQHYGGAVVANRAEGVFNQPNELGLFAAVVLLVSAGWLFSERDTARRAAALAMCGGATGALLVSLSRGAWLGAVGGGLVLALLVPSARRTLALASIPLISLAAWLGAFSPEQPQVELVRARLTSIAVGSDANPYDNRPAIFDEAWRQVRARPLMGYGPGNFPVASARAASEAQTVGAYHAHNALLTTAAELGLPATLSLVAFTVALATALARCVSRAVRPRDAALAAGFGAALFAVVVHGLVDFPLRNPVVFTTVWLVAALGLSATKVIEQR
jgi:O-antigen ligase